MDVKRRLESTVDVAGSEQSKWMCLATTLARGHGRHQLNVRYDCSGYSWYNLETPCERKARYARDLRGGEEETLQNLLLNNKERFDYHSNQQKPLLSCRLGFVIFKI